jgi:hypothetical protein
MATDKPYRIKEEHSEAFQVNPAEADLAADKYHKVPGGVIVPQTSEFGGIAYGGKSEIVIQEVTMPGDEGGDVVTKPVGVFQKSKDSDSPPGSIAPSGLVAPVSHSPGESPLPKRKLIKVTLDSPIFGKVQLPVIAVETGTDCMVLVTDASEGFSFVPPVSDKAFTVNIDGKESGKAMFCGQSFERKTLKEQHLVLVPVV